MTESIRDTIVALLEEGETSGEIIGMGYKAGSVYSAQRKWRQGKIDIGAGDNTNASAKTTSSPITATTERDIESDPEIVELKKEIRKAELKRQLGMAKAPLDLDILLSAAFDVGRDRLNACDYGEDGLCTLWQWSRPNEIPKNIGEAVPAGEDGWRIRPSPLYCALCTAYLDCDIQDEVDAAINKVPLHDLRERFKCSCGTRGMVAVHFKCTNCGKESWWGWWPGK